MAHRRRGRPHGDRARADRAHRAGRRAPAHGPQPQRPGRDRHAPVRQAARASTSRTGVLVPARGRSSGSPRSTSASSCPATRTCRRRSRCCFSHHLLAYAWMLARDFTRLRHAHEAADVLPLGSAALAGTTFPLDREYVAERARASRRSARTRWTRSRDRDFLLDLDLRVRGRARCTSRAWPRSSSSGRATSSASSRMDDEFSTGSSIMPQKKNPDFAELVRGKTGRVLGDLHVAARDAQGAAARVQQGHAGGQGAGVRRDRHARRLACAR